MHDNTNAPLMETSSSAELNHALFSDYYAECCGKGGVALQLLGWICTLELATGGVLDTDYIEMVDVLMLQKLFAELDDTTLEHFLNIFNKGYRCTVQAKNHGQKCIQPTFADSGQFKQEEVLHSRGEVAVVRSANERAVNIAKKSWTIRRGGQYGMTDPRVMADVWLAWGFQVNYMYNTVL
jgi:hypothetical protein